MKALVDADIVAYSCAAYNDQFGWEATVADIDALMRRILEETDSDSYLAVLTGDNNFRYEIFPEYKANRKGKPRPQYLEESRAYIVTEWAGIVTNGYEADDRLGIEACSEPYGTTVVCSIDKDLMMIPGYHYNWRKKEREIVTPLDGLRSFYRSLLTGDSTDGITPVGGIGAVKSKRLINDLETEFDMYQTCKHLYGDDRLDEMHMKCKLLWIWRKENDEWTPPQESDEQRAVQE